MSENVRVDGYSLPRPAGCVDSTPGSIDTKRSCVVPIGLHTQGRGTHSSTDDYHAVGLRASSLASSCLPVGPAMKLDRLTLKVPISDGERCRGLQWCLGHSHRTVGRAGQADTVTEGHTWPLEERWLVTHKQAGPEGMQDKLRLDDAEA